MLTSLAISFSIAELFYLSCLIWIPRFVCVESTGMQVCLVGILLACGFNVKESKLQIYAPETATSPKQLHKLLSSVLVKISCVH